MGKYYRAKIVSLANKKMGELGSFIVTSTLTGDFREVLTGKKMGTVDSISTNDKHPTVRKELKNKKSGFSTLYVDMTTLEEIPKESLKKELLNYNKFDTDQIEMLFYMVALLNGEVPKDKVFSIAEIKTLECGIHSPKDLDGVLNYYGIKDYTIDSGKYIVSYNKKGYYVELLTGYRFGSLEFGHLGEEIHYDTIPEHESMLVDRYFHDNIKVIPNSKLLDTFNDYISVCNPVDLKERFDKADEEYKKRIDNLRKSQFGPKK